MRHRLSQHNIFILGALQVAEQRRLDSRPALCYRLSDALDLLNVALDTVYVVSQLLNQPGELLILLNV